MLPFLATKENIKPTPAQRFDSKIFLTGRRDFYEHYYDWILETNILMYKNQFFYFDEILQYSVPEKCFGAILKKSNLDKDKINPEIFIELVRLKLL